MFVCGSCLLASDFLPAFMHIPVAAPVRALRRTPTHLVGNTLPRAVARRPSTVWISIDSENVGALLHCLSYIAKCMCDGLLPRFGKILDSETHYVSVVDVEVAVLSIQGAGSA